MTNAKNTITKEQKEQEKQAKEIEKQGRTKKMVFTEVLHNLFLTIKQEHENNKNDLPLYYECANYKKDAETGEYPEVMEYWAVSEWLSERLKEKNEIVFYCLDFKVWGRQTTGQAIYMDETIKEIAEKY